MSREFREFWISFESVTGEPYRAFDSEKEGRDWASTQEEWKDQNFAIVGPFIHARDVAEHNVENHQLRSFREDVLKTATKLAMLDVPPPMLIQKDPGRLPDDYNEKQWVPKESYDTLTQSLRLAYGAVDAMKAEYKALKESADKTLAHYEKAIRFYADPRQWTKHGDAIADAGKTAQSAMLNRPSVFLYEDGIAACERKIKSILEARQIPFNPNDVVGDLVRGALNYVTESKIKVHLEDISARMLPAMGAPLDAVIKVEDVQLIDLDPPARIAALDKCTYTVDDYVHINPLKLCGRILDVHGEGHGVVSKDHWVFTSLLTRIVNKPEEGTATLGRRFYLCEKKDDQFVPV